MPKVTLRLKSGVPSPEDLQAEVKDNTFEYLLTSSAAGIRVSAYLDRDHEMVQRSYAELFISDNCPFLSTIAGITPGSRTRKDIQLPGPMKEGEQLTLEVKRAPLKP